MIEDPDYQLGELYPDQVVRCLAFRIKGDTMMWTTLTWNKAIRFSFQITLLGVRNEDAFD